MSGSNDPILHLTLGIEELLRAAAEGLAAWRKRRERDRSGVTEPRSPREAPARPRGPFDDSLDALRAAIEHEHGRWQPHAAHDPAARRLSELCEAVLDLLGDHAPSTARTGRRTTPRRPRPKRV
ncbi:MAG: hypothetical protein ACE5FG_13795 [Myxococcota bacterium]